MRGRLQRVTKWLSIVATVGMFIVLVMGATVTVTGSGAGCGTSWPLCNGEFIPDFAIATAIEYSHRLVTGVEGLLILGTALGAFICWRRRLEVRILVPLMILFLLLQAALGALSVIYPGWWGRDTVLALHFGISLIAFATTLLTALLIIGMQNGLDALRDRVVPTGVRWATWGIALYTYAAVYLGAYVRHTDASLACLDWPLCQGSVFPGFTGPVGIVFSHRLAAVFLTLGVGWLCWWCWQLRAARPDLAWAGVFAMVTLLAQSATGAAIVFTRLNLFSSLAHGAVVTLYFGALSYLCYAMLPRPRGVRAREGATVAAPAAGRYPASSTGARVG